MKQIFLLFLLIFFSPIVFADEITSNTSVRFALKGKNTSQEAVLLDAKAQVKVNSIVSETTLTHEFENPSDDWVEGNYLFPLPANATVDRLVMLIGDKKIVGKIHKKANAKKLYQKAVNNGQKAAMLEMNRNNLFTSKVGNIPPHGKISITLHYIQPTHYDSGLFSLTIPTTYTPRYIVKNEINAPENSIKKTTSNPLPEQHFSSETQNRLKISITLNAGAIITELNSNSHTVKKDFYNDGKSANITTTEQHILMNKDFQLNWRLIDNGNPLTLAFTEQTNDGYYTSFRLVPTLKPLAKNYVQPRDITLIIDTSGSMGGESIRQAKAGALAALQYLNPNDRFNLIEFNSQFSSLFLSPLPVNKTSLAKARRFINALQAGGGTNMYEPLDAALSIPNNKEYLHQIVFLTDGAIDNEVRLFKLIRDKLKQSRLFTVAIGSAPNDFFMRQAAKAGRGDFTKISQTSEVKNTIKTLFSKLQSPSLTDLQLNLANHGNGEVYPNPLPDVYVGNPIIAHIKTDSPPSNISVTARLQGEKWQAMFDKKPENIAFIKNSANSPLAKLWAREKIMHITERQNYDEQLIEWKDYVSKIEALGLHYQIITDRTAFVAIEETISRDLTQPLKEKPIKNQTPAGMTFPATSTSSTLTALLGSFLVLLALIISFYRQRNGSAS